MEGGGWDGRDGPSNPADYDTLTIRQKCDLVQIRYLLDAEHALRQALHTAVLLDRRQDCTREALQLVLGALKAVRKGQADLFPVRDGSAT